MTQMTRHRIILALGLTAALILALASLASAREGERLPFLLEVVNSHAWGEGTEAWIGDMDGDGLDEAIGANPGLAQICPIRFVGGTYLEVSQFNLPRNPDEFSNVVYLGPLDIDDDPAEEFLVSAVVHDTVWLFCYDMIERLRKIPIETGVSISRDPWWDGSVANVVRVELGNAHGFAVSVNVDHDRYPREILLFDSTFEHVLWRYEGGAQFKTLVSSDVDGDGRDEVVFGTSSVSNGVEVNGTDDGHSYVGVLDDDGTLLWLKNVGETSTDARPVAVDLAGDGLPEIAATITPEIGDPDVRSTVAVWQGADGEPLGEVRIPARAGPPFAGQARDGRAYVCFSNGGGDVFELGLVDRQATIIRRAEMPARGDVQNCVSVDGVAGDCIFAGLENGRVLVYDSSLRLLAEHQPIRAPLFYEGLFLGRYRESPGVVRLAALTDKIYFFDLVRSPFDWAFFWIIVSVAAGSALVTALSVSRPFRWWVVRLLVAALTPIMPWAAAARANARLELLTELETGSHDKTIVTRPLRHLVGLLTMARGAGKGPEEMAALAGRWTGAYAETSRPALGRILDLARAWGGAVGETAELQSALVSAEDGVARLEAALDGDPAPELSSLAMRVGALEAALKALRSAAGRAYVTEIVPAMRDVLDLKASELRDLGVAVDVDASSVEGVSAWVTPADLQFVVSNLVDNAVRAMRAPGDRRLHIKAAARGGFVELRFSDTGCGIPDSERESVFALGETTKRGSGGTGLHRSREALATLGGSIDVESTVVGAGTTMVVRLRMV